MFTENGQLMFMSMNLISPFYTYVTNISHITRCSTNKPLQFMQKHVYRWIPVLFHSYPIGVHTEINNTWVFHDGGIVL